MFAALAGLFSSFRWGPEDRKWRVLQFVSLLGILVGATDEKIIGWGAWLGIHLSPIAAHWVILISAVVLVVAGKMDVSSFTKAANERRIDPNRLAAFVLPLLLATSVALMGCATATVKTVLVRSHQAIEVSLAAADDAERVLCFGSTIRPVDAGKHCTTAAATAIGLTDERHQVISRHLATAFDLQIQLSPILTRWPQNGVLPAEFQRLLDAARAIEAEVKALASVDAAKALKDKVAAWVRDLNALRRTFGGGL